MDATLRRLRALGAAGTAADLAAADQAAAAEQQAAAEAAAGAAAGAAAEKEEPLEVGAEEAAEGAAAVERQLQLAGELRQLFSSGRPDLEAGCIAAIHIPPDGTNGSGSGAAGSNGSTEQQSRSLLRVAVSTGKGSGGRRAAGQRFLAVPTSAAEALAEAPSREAQLALLQSLPEWRAVGRQAAELGALAAAARRQRAGGGTHAGGGAQPAAAAGVAAADRRQGRGRVFLIPQRIRLRQ